MNVARMRRGAPAAAVLAAAVIFSAAAARAEGAFSLGYSGDIARDGIAYGYSVNNEKADMAAERSLAECRSGRKAPRMASVCKFVTAFKNECSAVAWDPTPGTPGIGVGFASTQSSAEERALVLCKVTAGAGRGDQCKVNKSICDVTK
jgi:hypothetical protein